MTPSLLIVEDDETFRIVLADHLRQRGFDVAVATRVATARQISLHARKDVLLLDQNLPDGDGVTLAQELLAAGIATKIILVTAHADLARAIAATRAGVYDYLQKPVELATLEETIRRAARAAREESAVFPPVRSNREGGPPPLLGAGRATRRLRAQLEAAARACPAPVLITGETGSGKGLAARLVHAHGARSRGPFVVVNCAAIPESMFEAELFGHERGAFTGAHESRPGLFEVAHGGTLVLDEIGESSLGMQSKLLRALEEGVVRRVGAKSERIVDVSVVATTNRNVESLVASAEFRRDLYYRIAVLRIEVPPLRERREDLPLMVQAFLAEVEASSELKLGAEEMDALQQHDWPGNVRELRNVLQRWLLAKRGGYPDPISELQRLAERVGREQNSEVRALSSGEATVSSQWWPPHADDRKIHQSEFPSLAELEERHIRAAMTEANQNRTHAARLLGISRATLRRKLKEERGHG